MSPPDLNTEANRLKAEGDLHGAEALYRQAIAENPHAFEALNNLGNLLRSQGLSEEAEACLRRALKASPDHPDIECNLAVLCHELGRMPEAEALFDKVLRAHPQHLEARNNVGNLYKDLRRFHEARACYAWVLGQYPDHPEARWNLGLLQLMQGDYAAGWAGFEARYDPRRQNREVKPPNLKTPRWQGEALQGQRLMIWPEQGHGDEIQFVRYLPEVRKRFKPAEIILVCKPPLQALFTASAGADGVIPLGARVPRHDCWVLLGSIAQHFARTPAYMPQTVPYLKVPQDRRSLWRSAIPASTRLRVGIAWAGSPLHKNDRHRSVPKAEWLAPLWQVPGIEFIHLQRDQAPLPVTQPAIALGDLVRDFADSAAVLAEIDLLITVDSALAHLAGALGRPCWVLLPWQGQDWRWGESGEHSVWYPGALRLFRQAQAGDWPGLVKRVQKSLAAWAEGQQQQATRWRTLPPDDRQRVTALVSGLLDPLNTA